MKKITYILALGILYPISWLPFPVLYLFSDFLRYTLYYVFRYRRKVVQENLLNSFPEKTKEELQRIEKRYYKNLCDIIVETIKSLTISQAEISKRCKILDLDILDEYAEKEQSVIAVLGHYGNWEWAALSSALSVKQPMVVVYKPLSNPHFDRLIRKTRARFGVQLVAMRDVARFYIKNKQNTFVNCLVTDQSPSNLKTAIWQPFLNRETAILPGAEKLARKYGHPLVFVSLSRVGRGHYHLNMKKIVENPKETREGEITCVHTGVLEAQVREKPENWLWSHKRWKHSKGL